MSINRDDEQAAFEAWLVRLCPSGDADSVHAQWLESSDYQDLCDQAFDVEAERITYEDFGAGSINPSVTSIDDLFIYKEAAK